MQHKNTVLSPNILLDYNSFPIRCDLHRDIIKLFF